MPATRGIKARVAKNKLPISLLVVLLGCIIIYELRTGLQLVSLNNDLASATQVSREDPNVIASVRESTTEELLKQKASVNLEEDPVQRILLSIGSQPAPNPANRPDRNIITSVDRSSQGEPLKQTDSLYFEEDPLTRIVSSIASQRASKPERKPDQLVIGVAGGRSREEPQKASPNLEEDVHRVLASIAAQQSSDPEKRLDLEAVPQPETSLHGEHRSESLQPDGTTCSSRSQHFRSGMSEECKQLWRDDIFTRPLPTQFAFVHIPKAGTSFTTTLRNYLPQCRVKDVACPHGEVSDEELRCNGALAACDGHNHLDPDHLEQVRRNSRFRGVAMVSMLRDPVRRLISAKNHDCHRHSGTVQFSELKKPCEQYDYEGFVDLPNIQHCQTKMMHKFFCAEDVLPTQISLNAAEYNLFSLDFFGLTDEWNRSIRMFHCQFGGELRSSELMNTRPGKYDKDVVVENTTANYIHNAETLDSKLYEYALDLFNKREECIKCPPGCV